MFKVLIFGIIMLSVIFSLYIRYTTFLAYILHGYPCNITRQKRYRLSIWLFNFNFVDVLNLPLTVTSHSSV